MFKAKADKLYTSVAPMLSQIAQLHRERFGGCPDDIRSDIGICYAQAAARFKPGKCKFSTWIRYKVPLALLDLERRRFYQRSPVPLSHEPRCEDPGPRMIDFLDSLSDDARAVALAVIDSPRDIIMAMHERGGENNRNRKLATIEFFKLLGWSKDRITKTFAEIGRALS